jgi:hypothetical protein
MSEILAPVSFGELLDKVTILQIKSERIADPVKVANVRKELHALERLWNEHPASNIDVSALVQQLKHVNERLWVIEDDIRIFEKAQRFDNEFVELARSVYFERKILILRLVRRMLKKNRIRITARHKLV